MTNRKASHIHTVMMTCLHSQTERNLSWGLSNTKLDTGTFSNIF